MIQHETTVFPPVNAYFENSSCVALLDVVEKSSIGQNATTTSRSASAVTDGVRPTNTAWNRGWSCGLVTTSDSQAVPHGPRSQRDFEANCHTLPRKRPNYVR